MYFYSRTIFEKSFYPMNKRQFAYAARNLLNPKINKQANVTLLNYEKLGVILGGWCKYALLPTHVLVISCPRKKRHKLLNSKV